MPLTPDPQEPPPRVIDLSTVRDISPEALDADGRLRVLPAAHWRGILRRDRFVFGALLGLYSYPTVELVERLREIIAGRSAIEVGAGHGVLADALGIPGTDNREQDDPAMQLLYAMHAQSTVSYGPNIVHLDAVAAVQHYRPEVVIGCWVTQNHDDAETWTSGLGKRDGVDEEWIVDHCDTYVLIGNEQVHEKKRIWQRPHTIEYPDYVISRAVNGSRDFIATWQRDPKGTS